MYIVYDDTGDVRTQSLVDALCDCGRVVLRDRTQFLSAAYTRRVAELVPKKDIDLDAFRRHYGGSAVRLRYPA